MKKKEKLKCPLCSIKFIPRTFYPEEATFSSDGKLLSGFNGYISSSGVKPAEVILGSWITYCPNCNYIMKFVKEIVKKEKIQSQSITQKDIKQKYKNASVELMIVDMSLQSSIKQFALSFQDKYDHLDVLIHNAAYFDISQKRAGFTKENVEIVWATNHIGPVLLTKLLLNSLKKSNQGRVILVSSKGLIVFPFLKVDLQDPEFKNRRFKCFG